MKVTFNELLRKANKGSRNSQLRLGEYYLRRKQMEEAAKWLQKAADQNDPYAQYHLGFLYFQGLGVARDAVKAADYLKSSAEQEHAEAQAQLGSFYMQGFGVSKDEQMALFWTRKAAVQGSALAQCNLGIAYLEGIGMGKNADKARMNLLKSLENGYEYAEKILLEQAELLRSQEDDPYDKDYMVKLIEAAKETFRKKSDTAAGAETEDAEKENDAEAEIEVESDIGLETDVPELIAAEVEKGKDAERKDGDFKRTQAREPLAEPARAEEQSIQPDSGVLPEKMPQGNAPSGNQEIPVLAAEDRASADGASEEKPSSEAVMTETYTQPSGKQTFKQKMKGFFNKFFND